MRREKRRLSDDGEGRKRLLLRLDSVREMWKVGLRMCGIDCTAPEAKIAGSDGSSIAMAGEL